MMKTLLLLLLALPFACYSQMTLIPDIEFELKLIERGLDFGEPDGQVLTSTIDTVEVLYIYGLNILPGDITDLTGIEDFTALKELHCGFNDIETLDLSNNVNLTHLFCSYNFLTDIDVSNNPELTTLMCLSNSIESIDLSNNSNLDSLGCSSNKLSSLNISNNPELKYIYMNHQSGDPLTHLDISNNINLQELHCGSVGLTSLDASNNPDLTVLTLFTNDLQTLNIQNGNNDQMTMFGSNFNPDLLCIQVDDEEWAAENWTSENNIIDENSSFSENCNFVSVQESSLSQISMYPNPALDHFTIQTAQNVEGHVIISDVLGQEILNVKLDSEKTILDLSEMTSVGLYWVSVLDNSGERIFAERLIVE